MAQDDNELELDFVGDDESDDDAAQGQNADDDMGSLELANMVDEDEANELASLLDATPPDAEAAQPGQQRMLILFDLNGACYLCVW
jgi:hypothetical protein